MLLLEVAVNCLQKLPDDTQTSSSAFSLERPSSETKDEKTSGESSQARSDDSSNSVPHISNILHIAADFTTACARVPDLANDPSQHNEVNWLIKK